MCSSVMLNQWSIQFKKRYIHHVTLHKKEMCHHCLSQVHFKHMKTITLSSKWWSDECLGESQLMRVWLWCERTDCNKSIVGTFTHISSPHSRGRIHSLPNTHHCLRGRVTAQAVPASTHTYTNTMRHVHVIPLQHSSPLIGEYWMQNRLTTY